MSRKAVTTVDLSKYVVSGPQRGYSCGSCGSGESIHLRLREPTCDKVPIAFYLCPNCGRIFAADQGMVSGPRKAWVDEYYTEQARKMCMGELNCSFVTVEMVAKLGKILADADRTLEAEARVLELEAVAKT